MGNSNKGGNQNKKPEAQKSEQPKSSGRVFVRMLGAEGVVIGYHGNVRRRGGDVFEISNERYAEGPKKGKLIHLSKNMELAKQGDLSAVSEEKPREAQTLGDAGKEAIK